MRHVSDARLPEATRLPLAERALIGAPPAVSGENNASGTHRARRYPERGNASMRHGSGAGIRSSGRRTTPSRLETPRERAVRLFATCCDFEGHL